jgi:hypothetical protein
MSQTATPPKPQVFERGDKLYFVNPLTPFTPDQGTIKEFAFAEQLKSKAPNEHLMWLRGQYVEADHPNANGQMWTEGELAIKQLTPMLMPVTVMHDERTAVGLIADLAMLTPEADKVPRSRIDTSLALWKHRFPEVCEEAQVNYEAGSLMQSMECLSPDYTCAECGKFFAKLPNGAERAGWCEHLAEADGFGARILGNVVFTGTGLIFGTRGARGANDQAHLEVFQDEIAEHHEKAHRDSGHTARDNGNGARKVRNVETVEISKSEYDALQADKAKLAEVESELSTAKSERDEAVTKVEEAEAATKKAEEAQEEAEKKVKTHEEQAQKAELASDRLGALGGAFKEKLGEFTRKRLDEQAKSLSDAEWDARLTELEEMSSVKRDAKKDGESEDEGGSEKDGEFSREEVASAGLGGGSGKSGGSEPSSVQRSSVVAGLMGPNGNGNGSK